MEDLIEKLTPDYFYQLHWFTKIILGIFAWLLFWFIFAYLPFHKK